MKEFEVQATLILADYKNRFSSEIAREGDPTERFIYLQNILQEFNEKLDLLALEHSQKYNFEVSQKNECHQMIASLLDELSACI